MRLMTWNVNGIKTLLQYHPWYTLKTYEALLQALEADIICVQETKITQAQITRDLAIIPSFDSFFSSYCRKPPRGYSGTAIFTKKTTCVPLKAEEGLSGTLQLQHKIPTDDLVGSYPSLSSLDIDPNDVTELDLEGRATVVDLRLFVLINLYCPNQTNEHRLAYKENFNALLAARVDALVKAGREVVVVGDINICAQAIDHAEPEKRAKDHGLERFEDHPSRKWFNRWLGREEGFEGTLVDVTRKFHPDRKRMFTCWETKIDARASNFGTRLDHILVTPGLLSWIKHSDIQPSIYGSDHCPVYADFHDSITTSDGRTLYLWEEINHPGRRKDADPPTPPKFAARNYDEFSGKQKLLSSFFGKKGASASRPSASPSPALPGSQAAPHAQGSETPVLDPTPSPSEDLGEISVSSALKALHELPEEHDVVREASGTPTAPVEPLVHAVDDSVPSVPSPAEPSASAPQPLASTSKPHEPTRRPSSSQPELSKGKGKATKPASTKKASAGKAGKNSAVVNGQPTLAGFFKPPPKPARAKLEESKKSKGKAKAAQEKVTATDDEGSGGGSQDTPQTNGDFDEAIVDEAMVDEETIPSSANAEYNAEASAKWSALLAPKAPPRCSMHNEVCKEFTVNKPGPNKGRRFWLCSRPVGPGSESKTKDKSLSDPQWKCDFFQWQTGVKRPSDFGGDRINKKMTPVPKGDNKQGSMNGGKHGHG